ncbi:MAG: Sip1-related alpha-galactosidase [Tannerellaceae bacterium]
MKKIHFIVLLLISSAYCLAQSPFVYEKGKSFKEVKSWKMPSVIDVQNLPSPILYEDAVPIDQTTISYRVQLPAYIRGVFFSRDSRPGDHQWPNNTNRLLPWAFNRLGDLTKADYPGIPSNGKPSELGDALLLQLADGSYLFTKALSGENCISWFQLDTTGGLTLNLSTLGKDALSNHAPLLLAGKGNSAYNLLRSSYQSLIADKEVATLKRREDKIRFEAFDYLGWCTWEQYHVDIDERKILHALDVIENSGIPVRYLLIDDGSLQFNRNQLTTMQPSKERFPNGFENIVARKKEGKVQWMGLWYALSGYWMGISPENSFSDPMKRSLYLYNGSLLPGRSTENIQAFYRRYVQTLKDYGFDFLKIDNQSFTLPLYMGDTAAVRCAKECNLALEEQTHDLGVGLMNCMAQNLLNTDHTQYSATARVSIDYKKFNKDMAKSHLFQSYANTLLQGQTVWPDHDMFHSSDSICGRMMARSKALSGGPVYLSDAPEAFVAENIWPLIDEQGKLFRPLAPGVPTPESLLINPLQDGKAYRVFAPTGDEAVSLICYNLNTSSTHQKVCTTISKEDYLLRKEYMSASADLGSGQILLYDWENQTAELLVAPKQVVLDGFTDRLFHLCPIHQGWAVIGLQNKYLSPSTVQILSCSEQELKLNVFSSGTLKVWREFKGKQELRSILIDTPGEITLTQNGTELKAIANADYQMIPVAFKPVKK